MAFLCLYPLLYSLLLRAISNGYSLLSLTVHANKWKKGVLFSVYCFNSHTFAC